MRDLLSGLVASILVIVAGLVLTYATQPPRWRTERDANNALLEALTQPDSLGRTNPRFRPVCVPQFRPDPICIDRLFQLRKLILGEPRYLPLRPPRLVGPQMTRL